MIDIVLKRIDFSDNVVQFSNLYIEKKDDYSYKELNDFVESNDDKNGHLRKALESLEQCIISDAKPGGKTKEGGYDLYHNSSGIIGTEKNFTIFYRVLASVSNPGAGAAFKAPQRISCYPMTHVNKMQWRVLDLDKVIELENKTGEYQSFTIGRTTYYVFVELVAIGRHTGDTTYEFDVYNKDLCDRTRSLS